MQIYCIHLFKVKKQTIPLHYCYARNKPNQGQLTAVKTGHLQTTITKLITWAQVQDPSFRRQFAPTTSWSEMSYSH